MSLTENALNVYNKLYFTKAETTSSQAHKRIADAIGDTDEFKKEIFDALEENVIRPNSPVLINAGIDRNPQLSACFVGNLEDSLESIFDFDKEAGLIYSKGSGIGCNYGVLREKGAELSQSGQSSGACSFMYKLAATAECVKSGGCSRRSAHLAMFTDNHPDIEEFITIKNGKDNRLRSMNLSIAITDKFMKAVENNDDWNLIGVKDKQIKKTLKAKDLYDQIITNSYKTGDPGLWFIDRVNADNPFKDKENINCCNPCFKSDTLIPTKNGVFPIIDLVGKEVEVYDGEQWVKCNNFRKTGENQEILKITLSNGSYLEVTPYHTMYLENGDKLQAKDLNISNRLEYSNVVSNNTGFRHNAIIDIKKDENLHTVYCCTIPTTHKILTSTGIVTGQCGEQSLLPYGSCNLIHINLNNCLTEFGFDFDKLKYYTRLCTRFADNVIDISGYPTDKYKQSALNYRPIGIGIMGLADILIKLNIPYNSHDGIALAGQIIRRITKDSIVAGSELAKEKGVFSFYNEFKRECLTFAKRFFRTEDISESQELDYVFQHGLRNSNWTTIAPTGSVSISADSSAGSEPLFGLVFEKHISDSDNIWLFVNPEFEKRYKHFDWYKDAIKQISKDKGSCKNISQLTDYDKKVFATAHDIKWSDRLKMQEALQEGCSNSLSVTINLPKESTIDDVKSIYFESWKKNLKGITIYRDGSLDEQPITFGKADINTRKSDDNCILPELYKKELLDIEKAERHRCNWKNSRIYINVSLDENDMPIELFTKLPREAGINGDGIFNLNVWVERCSNWDLISRLVSMALRYNIPLEDIISQCDKSKASIVDAAGILSRILKKYIVDEQEEDEDGNVIGHECPDCHRNSLIKEGGCSVCYNCNFSKCG